MESMQHSSALDGLIAVIVKKAVNQLRPSNTVISLTDNGHTRALIKGGYLAIVQDEPNPELETKQEQQPEHVPEQAEQDFDDEYEED